MFCHKFWSFAAVMIYFGINNVHADGPPTQCPYHALIMECAKEHGVSEEEVIEAKKTHNIDFINPCLFSCLFKKKDLMNSKGMYDVDKTVEMTLKMYLKNDENAAKIDEIKKDCAKVNDAQVSDGDKGCERGALLFKCLADHKQELLGKE